MFIWLDSSVYSVDWTIWVGKFPVLSFKYPVLLYTMKNGFREILRFELFIRKTENFMWKRRISSNDFRLNGTVLRVNTWIKSNKYHLIHQITIWFTRDDTSNEKFAWIHRNSFHWKYHLLRIILYGVISIFTGNPLFVQIYLVN